MTHALRQVNKLDHEFLVELHNDPVVLRNITNPTPVTLDGHMQWWETISKDPAQLRLIFEIDGNRAGFAKFYDIDLVNKNCILGADLHASFRGMRHAETMWSLMLDKCFKEMSMHRVSLTTAQYNVIAIHVYEKLGFDVEGYFVQSLFRDGTYYDQICMYMLRDKWLEGKNE